MAAAFCTQRLSASPSVSFRQIRIPARGIIVNSGPVSRTRTMAMSMDKARHPEVVDVPRERERDFLATPYVPVYITLPLGIINMKGEIVDVDALLNQLNTLKSAANIDGISIECWWGIVEPHAPHTYNWSGYHKLFKIVRNARLKIRVYFDLMRSFRMEFNEFFENGTIFQIEIGLGPCGELRYPSHSAKFGWKYPGIGEFQCYDKYLFKSLQKAAEARGTSLFGKAPKNAGSYNSKPQNTGFFRDGGEYNSFYGMFFSKWYRQVLIDHADQVLGMANLAFKGTPIAAKLPGIHWCRNTKSRAAELTAGFYNCCYHQIASMLKKHESTLNFACLESGTFDEVNEYRKALADPERPVWEKEFLKASADAYALVWEVLIAAWEADIPAAGENAHPCYNREGYNKMLENAKPWGDPSCRCHLSVFTYIRLGPTLLEKHNIMEFGRFVQKMHGVPYN